MERKMPLVLYYDKSTPIYLGMVRSHSGTLTIARNACRHKTISAPSDVYSPYYGDGWFSDVVWVVLNIIFRMGRYHS